MAVVPASREDQIIRSGFKNTCWLSLLRGKYVGWCTKRTVISRLFDYGVFSLYVDRSCREANGQFSLDVNG